MARRSESNYKLGKEFATATSAEARENQLINLAYERAEQQLRDGTASSQVITHFLKLGSSEEKLRSRMMEEQNKLLVAKTEALESQKRSEELAQKAIEAFRRYSGEDEWE